MKRLAIVCSLLIGAAGGVRPQQAPQIEAQHPSDKSWVVEGNVVDDNGPVRDVSIHLNSPADELGALTDENGHYQLTARVLS
jgi:hypothetical protein